MNVISFTGMKRSGKDSAASFLIKHSPDQYIPVSFAAPLKIVCEKYWGGYGISEQDREIVRVFRLQFRDIVKGMGELGFASNLAYPFTERMIDVFSDYIVSVDERFIEISCSYRTILQLVGTDICRHFNDTIWIDKAKKAIDNAHALGKDVVITDLRFDNEAHMLSEEYNAFIVEVKRELCYNPSQLQKHDSEKGLSTEYVDYIIYNTGTLEEYESKVLNLIGGNNGS